MLFLDSLNQYLSRALSVDNNVILLGEDIEDPYGGAFKVTKGLSSKFPGRVRNMPISEQAICGIGAGMAVGGLKPVIEIMFGDFLSLCFDQILNHISKFPWMFNGKVNCPLVIRTPMGGRRGYGPTHSQSIEKHFIGIPGLKVVSPSLYHNPGKMLLDAIRDLSPVLFIETKRLYASRLIDKESVVWERQVIGEVYPTIRYVTDGFNGASGITIVVYGGMADIVVNICEELFMEEELQFEIFIVSDLTSPPYDNILSSVRNTGRLCVIEEGGRRLGWGAEVVSSVLELSKGARKNIVAKRIAARDLPIPANPLLENQVLPSKEYIAKELKTMLGEGYDRS